MITTLNWWRLFTGRKIWKTEDQTALNDASFPNKATIPVLGNELVRNGVFEDQIQRLTDDIYFIAAGGWTFDDRGATLNPVAYPWPLFPAAIDGVLEDGKQYRIKIDGKFKSGSLTLYFGEGALMTSASTLNDKQETFVSYIKGNGSLALAIFPSTDFSGTIRGISIRPSYVNV